MIDVCSQDKNNPYLSHSYEKHANNQSDYFLPYFFYCLNGILIFLLHSGFIEIKLSVSVYTVIVSA